MRRVGLLVISIFLFTSLAFAISDAQKKNEIQITLEGQSEGHRFGLVVTEPDSQTLAKYDLQGGAEIIEVEPNSEAQKAGLKAHDIIIKMDGEPIESPEDLEDYFSELDQEKDVDIVVHRSGKELIFTAHVQPLDLAERQILLRLKAGKLKAKADSIVKRLKMKLKAGRASHLKGGFLGIRAETLTEQLTEYFEVEYGVLVKKVLKDSPAEKSGIKAGDVIYKVNEKEIHDVEDLVRTLNYYDPGDVVKVYLKRKGKRKTISVTLGKKKPFVPDIETFSWPPAVLNPKEFRMKRFKGHLWQDEEESPLKEQEKERGIYRF